MIMLDVHEKLKKSAIVLPQVSAVGDYEIWQDVGNVRYFSGMLSKGRDQEIIQGLLVSERDLSLGQHAAEAAFYQLLAAVHQSVQGDWERIQQWVKLQVWVQSAPEFQGQHLVANAVSRLVRHYFEDRGRHVRAALGVAALPLGACVEIDALLRIQQSNTIMMNHDKDESREG